MSQAPSVTVNGKRHPLRGGATLGELLRELGLLTEGVAVAINLEVVPRQRVADRRLRDGDRVELVRAVGGG